jgi:tRNA threonylcarbamoyladenosine biosynthesis protein TsaB
MSLIINIDTSMERASVCLSKDGQSLGLLQSTEQKEHASFLHPAIQQLMQQCGYSMQETDAVAVTAGPGSYTGLRVGLSSAKGLCFALNKPLIMVGTLEMMAFAALQQLGETLSERDLLCPMIDARRMEVFTALYDMTLQTVQAPCAMVLDGTSFAAYAAGQRIFFSGNGASKFGELSQHRNFIFRNVESNATHLAFLATEMYRKKTFADLAYAGPQYLKEFFFKTN